MSKSVGDKIKEIRTKKGLTQEELASLCNISRNSIYNYENNKREIPINILIIISEQLCVSILELLEYEVTILDLLKELHRRDKDE